MRFLTEKNLGEWSIQDYVRLFFYRCDESAIKDNPVLSELSRKRIKGIASERLNSIFTVTQSELNAAEKQHFENYVAACNALGLEQHYRELVAITIELKGEK